MNHGSPPSPPRKPPPIPGGRRLVALDVGGTSMKGAVLTEDLRYLSSLRRPTPKGEDAVEAVYAAVDALLAEARGDGAAAIGVAVPGIVDDDTGTAIWSENIGWRDVPFRERLAARTGLPVRVGHDVRAGGTAELVLGAARGARDALIVPIGTGLSAAVVIDGRLCVAGGYAGELGHIPVGGAAGGADEPCVCGATGCLEAVASAAAIGRRFTRRTGREATAATVAALAAEGDPDAAAVWADAVEHLAAALVAATALLGPEVIVIAGGLSEAGALLMDPLRDGVRRRLTFHRPPRLVRARHGQDAGRLGAALWARDLLPG
ncbi:ROK family protein [Spirillospora sp. NBC_01491]|uniref:ROK family protein n=1 Tax=Spirillospora sp. NBC_01491 TaxID=2976007 RepID=UPI002E312FD8|nr:ROK family protein [Spirillospora sp. NBC_01491]